MSLNLRPSATGPSPRGYVFGADEAGGPLALLLRQVPYALLTLAVLGLVWLA